ncbi:MAG: hypothetical protein KJ558_10250 [Gammaproteobacteria bacterium]|nr:hypothetical protein [Gammaproteobacteria bacterium]MBU1655188.1 hypothetical protein [Gammaproteobacteria bacterium]MBU1959999.1 hypothetical protein [Gammaproteobacteria bacterium]
MSRQQWPAFFAFLEKASDEDLVSKRDRMAGFAATLVDKGVREDVRKIVKTIEGEMLSRLLAE